LISTFKKLWKNEYFQTAFVIVIILIIVFVFLFGSQAVMGTSIFPALAVVSGSMCIPYGGDCDGWTHPFDRTLHIGDVIIIQGVNPADLNVDYPNSDIIVFHRPDNGELVVHRLVAKQEVDGELYFFTKGDGNSPPDVWPNPVPSYNYDHWDTSYNSGPKGAVRQDYIVGKVVARVPWIGLLPMIMQDTLGKNSSMIGIPIVILLIILLIIIEFVVPFFRRKKQSEAQKTTTEPPAQTPPQNPASLSCCTHE
jgi:signal peptidase I